MIDVAAAPPARIFTTWGTVLYVDSASGQLRHGPIETIPENAVIAADPIAAVARQWVRIVYTANGVWEPILCGAERSLSAFRRNGGDGEARATLLELVPVERD